MEGDTDDSVIQIFSFSSLLGSNVRLDSLLWWAHSLGGDRRH